jgi:hypothetical protein
MCIAETSGFAFNFVGSQYTVYGVRAPEWESFTLTASTDDEIEAHLMKNVSTAICDAVLYQSDVLEHKAHTAKITVGNAWWIALERIEIVDDKSTQSPSKEGSVHPLNFPTSSSRLNHTAGLALKLEVLLAELLQQSSSSSSSGSSSGRQ